MRLTDPIADMLTRIRNALMVNHPEVKMPYSALKESMLVIFRDEGYINNFHVAEDGTHKNIIVSLKYTETGYSVIRGLKRVSKPGCRIYVNSKNLTPVLGGLGHGLVSTSRGIKSIKQCISEKVGGEYLCQIW